MTPNHGFRQAFEPTAQRDELAAFEIIGSKRRDQARRRFVIWYGKGVLNGFCNHAVLFHPDQSLLVKPIYPFREIILQLCLKELSKERMILVPGTHSTDEKICLLNLCEQLNSIF